MDRLSERFSYYCGLLSAFVNDRNVKVDDFEHIQNLICAEEQGLVLKLPCKVGDTVYAICTCKDVETVLDGTMYGQNGGFGTATGYYCPYELNDKCPHTETDDCEECKNIENVFEDTIAYISIEEYDITIGLTNTNLCTNIYEIGKTIFHTQEQAEEALKKMREEEI